MNNQQTDNSFLQNKIKLRLEVINKIEKNTINILECFAGNNILYSYIQNKTKKKLNILSIEKINKKGNNIYGDNKKILPNLDLSFYDIIDADAYGNSFYLLDVILKNKSFKETWFIYTFISCMGKGLNKEILLSNNITEAMIKKCPMLFEKKKILFYRNFLYQKRVDFLYEKEYNNKRYGYFKLKACIGEKEIL